MNLRLLPDACIPNDHIAKEFVTSCPELSKQELKNFKKHTGFKIKPKTKVVRYSPSQIFAFNDESDLAVCLYAYHRDFN